jgi:hypothetical protein
MTITAYPLAWPPGWKRTATEARTWRSGAVVLERAFTGFTALPAPIVAGMKRHWRDVLEFGNGAPTRESITSHCRILASTAHPDKGGSAAAMAEFNQARKDALKECT